MDLIAGIRSQIKQLKDRLKTLNPAKHKPSEIQSLMGDLDALESRYEKEKAKRDEKRKVREEAAAAKPEEVSKEADTVTDKVEKDPKIAPHVIVPDSVKEHDKIVEKVEQDPKIAPAIISKEEPKPEEMDKEGKFDIDCVVEPTRGTPGSKGRVMRHDSPKDLVYVMWEEGPLKDREQFGGYYPQDLKKKSADLKPETNCPCYEDTSVYCPRCKDKKTQPLRDLESDLKSNFDAIMKDLKDEREAHYTQGNHAWVARLDQKIKDLQEKIDEKFPPKKEASEENGSGGTERLTVKDFTTTDSNSSAKSQEGSDPNDGYAGMWAEPDGRDLESKLPGKKQKELDALIQQAVYGYQINIMDLSKVYAAGESAFLKGEDVIAAVQAFLENMVVAGKATKTASLDKSGKYTGDMDKDLQILLPHVIADGVTPDPAVSEWLVERARQIYKANPSWGQTIAKETAHSRDFLYKFMEHWLQAKESGAKMTASKQYDVVDNNGKKVMSVKSEKELSLDQLSQIFAKESKKQTTTAKLLENLAFLKAGEKVTIIGYDKARKRVKFASAQHDVRGWAPESKFKIYALDAQTVKHGDHDDKVLGATGSETLIDCSANGPTWVSSTELMDANRPPATPESLHEEPAIEEEASKECPDCHGTFVGEEGEKCPTCGRFSVMKESLKRQLPPVLVNQRADVDPQPPVVDVPVQASLLKEAHIREEDGKWIVYNHDYTKKLGTYPSKEQALKRLRQIEYFKHQGSLSLSKKEAGEVLSDTHQALETQVQSLRDRMSAVNEMLQSNTLPKQAGEGDPDNSSIQLPELVEDLTMGLDLLETKLGQKDANPELSAGIEQMETLLLTLEKECGIEAKPNEAHRPDEMEVELESKKEAAVTSATTTTITNAPAAPSSPAPVTSTNPTATTPASQPVCALCGGQSFADYASYQNHMEYTHASDTMPTSPSQKNLSTTVGSLKKADTVTDETDTIITNDPNAVIPPPDTTTPAPVIQNVQPTDDDNLEVPVVMPSSPPSPGQKWVFDTQFNKYVSMPDPEPKRNPAL